MGLRTLARTTAKNMSYKKSKTTDMVEYFFDKKWREKGHPANRGGCKGPGPTKKGHRPMCI